jgi:hypothetical protein
MTAIGDAFFSMASNRFGAKGGGWKRRREERRRGEEKEEEKRRGEGRSEEWWVVGGGFSCRPIPFSPPIGGYPRGLG